MSSKKSKGITLVALVITIIILLILAGITISTLTNIGLFENAKKAKEESEKAEQEQSKILSEYEKTLNEYTAENLTDAKTNVVLSETENTVLKDVNGNIFTVPAGFKIVVNDDTSNAKTVDKGIVIEDVTETATKGSQFVWVPVGEITKSDGTKVTIDLNRYTFNDDGTPTAQNENIIDAWYQELNSSNKGNTTAKNISDFKLCTMKNRGYYIGRYEGRTNVERNSGENMLTQLTENVNEFVYNFVTQSQSAQLSRNMYTSFYFTSDLINSYAWDSAIVFLQNCGTDSKYSKRILNTGVLASKGTATDVQCNIYDMVSNIYEWSTETSNNLSYPCTLRGNSYNSGVYFYTCSRIAHSIPLSHEEIGFRPILYMNV